MSKVSLDIERVTISVDVEGHFQKIICLIRSKVLLQIRAWFSYEKYCCVMFQ